MMGQRSISISVEKHFKFLTLFTLLMIAQMDIGIAILGMDVEPAYLSLFFAPLILKNILNIRVEKDFVSGIFYVLLVCFLWTISPPLNYLFSIGSLVLYYVVTLAVMRGIVNAHFRSYLIIIFFIISGSLLLDRLMNSIFGIDIFNFFHQDIEYRPALFLSHDTNWSHGFMLFLAFYIDRLKRNKWILLLSLILVLVDAARIHLVIWFLYVFISRGSYRLLLSALMGCLGIVLWVNSGSIDADFTYDLVDLSKNPRLNDFIAYLNVAGSGLFEVVMGNGLGSIWYYGASISWREPVYFVNNLLLQLFVELGFLGLLFAFRIVRRQDYVIVLFFLFCVFHNILFKPLGGMILILNKLVFEYNKNAIGVDN